MSFASVVNSQAELKPNQTLTGYEYEIEQLEKGYAWLDNPEFFRTPSAKPIFVANPVKPVKIYKPLSYQEQYFGYHLEDDETEIVRAIPSPKPNKPLPKTVMFEEGRRFRV
jgi:hypothetical protein